MFLSWTRRVTDYWLTGNISCSCKLPSGCWRGTPPSHLQPQLSRPPVLVVTHQQGQSEHGVETYHSQPEVVPDERSQTLTRHGECEEVLLLVETLLTLKWCWVQAL